MNIGVKIKNKKNIEFPIIIRDKKDRVIYCKNAKGYSYERTYDENDEEETYSNSSGRYKIREKVVTKEEFLEFINIPEYTIEELKKVLGNFKLKK